MGFGKVLFVCCSSAGWGVIAVFESAEVVWLFRSVGLCLADLAAGLMLSYRSLSRVQGFFVLGMRAGNVWRGSDFMRVCLCMVVFGANF